MTSFTESFSELELVINLRNITIGKGRKENKSYLKILYQFYRFIRDKRKIKQFEHFPSVQTMADNSKCSVRSVQYFLNSQFFKLYGERIFRQKTENRQDSNSYRINERILCIFATLEKKGVMKNIREDFDRFHRRYKKYMDNVIIAALENGLSLQDVMNKLRTKSDSILHPSPKQYCTLAATLSKLAQSPQQSSEVKTKPENESVIYAEITPVIDLLKDRLNFSDAESIGFIFKNSLSIVKRACMTLCYRIEKLKWRPRDKRKALQKIINDIKQAA